MLKKKKRTTAVATIPHLDLIGVPQGPKLSPSMTLSTNFKL